MVKSKGLNEAASSAIKTSSGKSFDLDAFKKAKYLTTAVKFKKQKWIPFSSAVKDALSIPGVPMGHVTIARGGSDTGKTSLLIEIAAEAQKMNILPVFIVTEMKWDFDHAKKMGLEVTVIPDEETGEIMSYEGFFLYVDRSSLNTIEDVSSFMSDLLDEQAKGRLPYDLLFLWDSVGSIPCDMSVKQGNNNPMWNAGAMATQFGNFINQKFPLSRKEQYPHTNTFFVINKTGVQPALTPMSQPKMTNKGGNAMYWDASIVITFGNVTNSGTSKIKAVKNGRNVEFAKRTKIAIDKIHADCGIATSSTIIVTPHGFIPDDDKAIKDYKKQYAKEWFEDLTNVDELQIIEDTSEWEESIKISPTVEIYNDEIN
jgi:hypothetical protein